MVVGYTRGKGKNRKFIPFGHYQKVRNVYPSEPDIKKPSYQYSYSNNTHFNKLKQQKTKEKIAIELELVRLKQKQENILKSKKTKEQEIQRKKHLEKIQTGIKTTAIVISSFEPHFAGMCLTYKFAKYGYMFVKKFFAYYRVTKSWDKALLYTVDDEIRDKISILLKHNKIKKATEILTRHLYDIFRSELNRNIDSKYESTIKHSMSYSLNYFIFNELNYNDVLEDDFTDLILEDYLKNIFSNNSTLNTDVILPTGFEKQLSKKISQDFTSGAIDSNSCLENTFNGTEWIEDKVPKILEFTL